MWTSSFPIFAFFLPIGDGVADLISEGGRNWNVAWSPNSTRTVTTRVCYVHAA